jgi:hypothetical protein
VPDTGYQASIASIGADGSVSFIPKDHSAGVATLTWRSGSPFASVDVLHGLGVVPVAVEITNGGFTTDRWMLTAAPPGLYDSDSFQIQGWLQAAANFAIPVSWVAYA